MSSSASDSGMKPPGVNASAKESDVKVETALDQGSSLGKRRAGLRARKVPAAPEAALDSDDEEPAKKKAKTEAPAEPWSKGRIIDKGIRIGIHKIGDDELAVYAVYYKNGTLNCRVYREEASSEVKSRHKAFFSSKAQLTMEKIVFDMSLFSKIGAHDIQSLKEEKQKAHIRSYLATL